MERGVLVLILVAALVACGGGGGDAGETGGPEATPADGDMLIVGISSDFDTLFPPSSNSANAGWAYGQVYWYLMRSNPDFVTFRPGLAELVVGRNAARAYQGFELGGRVRFGGGDWAVVGVMDAGGSGFDSEAWCDAAVLNQVYKRPTNIFQSATARLTGPDAFQAFKDALTKDPRLDVAVQREVDYYAAQSQMLTGLIEGLGFFIAFIMGIGAVFAALNTMYSAVSERGREIATLRALGFGSGAVVVSFVLELVGDERFMYASDIPHSDREFDAAGDLMRRDDVSDSAKRKLLADNAVRFYGL